MSFTAHGQEGVMAVFTYGEITTNFVGHRLPSGNGGFRRLSPFII